MAYHRDPTQYRKQNKLPFLTDDDDIKIDIPLNFDDEEDLGDEFILDGLDDEL